MEEHKAYMKIQHYSKKYCNGKFSPRRCYMNLICRFAIVDDDILNYIMPCSINTLWFHLHTSCFLSYMHFHKNKVPGLFAKIWENLWIVFNEWNVNQWVERKVITTLQHTGIFTYMFSILGNPLIENHVWGYDPTNRGIHHFQWKKKKFHFHSALFISSLYCKNILEIETYVVECWGSPVDNASR